MIFASRYKNWKNYVVDLYPTLMQAQTMKSLGYRSEFGLIVISSVNLLSDFSRLMNFEHKYKELTERHNKRSLYNRVKAYFFQAKKMKEQDVKIR